MQFAWMDIVSIGHSNAVTESLCVTTPVMRRHHDNTTSRRALRGKCRDLCLECVAPIYFIRLACIALRQNYIDYVMTP